MEKSAKFSQKSELKGFKIPESELEKLKKLREEMVEDSGSEKSPKRTKKKKKGRKKRRKTAVADSLTPKPSKPSELGELLSAKLQELDENQKPESSPQFEVGAIIENVVFNVEERGKGGMPIYKSSATGRKMIVLNDPPVSVAPELSRGCTVRVVRDTNPENPTKGKIVVEIPLELEQERAIITLSKEAKDLLEQDDLAGAHRALEEIRQQIFGTQN